MVDLDGYPSFPLPDHFPTSVPSVRITHPPTSDYRSLLLSTPYLSNCVVLTPSLSTSIPHLTDESPRKRPPNRTLSPSLEHICQGITSKRFLSAPLQALVIVSGAFSSSKARFFSYDLTGGGAAVFFGEVA